MTHTYSIETLYHFRCHACLQWWTIGDAATGILAEISCPKCGVKAAAESVSPLEGKEDR